ncbi:hypothetical protein R1flu_025072 [Riccia fluitans]|uniref:Uncharacterized protein n=1 Tax=Riccia fluitans TaxID=41844 RepID=A0ABD1XWQ0_9MARC
MTWITHPDIRPGNEMSTSSNIIVTSSKNWNSHPLDAGGGMKAVLSVPHLAFPSGFSRRTQSSASNVQSSLSTKRSFSSIRKRRSLWECPSFRLGNSVFFRTLSNNRRRSLVVRSAVDVVGFETHAAEFSSAILVLSDIFSAFSTSSFLNSLALVTTVLGVSSAFYAYSSREKGNGIGYQNLPQVERTEVLDGWLNLSKATPFNKYVTARCPSLAPCLEGIQRMEAGAEIQMEMKSSEYQRLCLHADDGGTVALDWPCNLDWEKNKELENVVLIIPGSIQGSEDKGIGKLTRDAERRGYFPVVLNPRGCGGSPLTTPRQVLNET